MLTSPTSTLGPTLARGALAGLAGTVVMTAFQRLVEMPLTGRRESYAPANLVTKLLPIRPKRQARRRLNYATHFAIGAGWGVAHGAAEHLGLRGQRAIAAVFSTIYVGDLLMNTALGLYEPSQWSGQDWAIDIGDKLLLAEATGIVFERLPGRR